MKCDACPRTFVVQFLEQRLTLSATAAVVDGVLNILGDDGPQHVVVIQQNLGEANEAVVRLDADGNGSLEDAGDLNYASFGEVSGFNIRLLGGDDQLEFVLPDFIRNSTLAVYANLGNGNDHFSFIQPQGSFIEDDSRVSVIVNTADGDDQAQFSVGGIRGGSQLGYRFYGGSGDDVSNLLINHVRDNASVGAALVMSSGDDTVLSTFGGDVAGSQVQLTAGLGGGHDHFEAFGDLESLDIYGADSALRIKASGGSGNDQLSFRHGEYAGGSGVIQQGLLDIVLRGDGGQDNLLVDTGTFNVAGGTMRIRADGGTNNDHIDVQANAFASSSGGTFDIKLFGSAGTDVLALRVYDSSESSSFARGNARIDGGPGQDRAATDGNAPYSLRSLEA